MDPLWFHAFLLTLGVEVPVAVVLAPRGQRGFGAGVAAGVQLLTHPMAWLAFSGGVGWWSVEVGVAVVEATVYALAFGRPARALGVSLVANALSAVAGVRLLGP